MKSAKNKKMSYFIISAVLMIIAVSTSFAYILINHVGEAQDDTEHGNQISIIVALEDFSDQILIPQKGIPTNENEIKTLDIKGTVKLDDKATDQDFIPVSLTYVILVNDVERTNDFDVNFLVKPNVLTNNAEVFNLEVSLKDDVILEDNAKITVRIIAAPQGE